MYKIDRRGGGRGWGGSKKWYTRTDHFMLFCTKVDKRLFLGPKIVY